MSHICLIYNIPTATVLARSRSGSGSSSTHPRDPSTLVDEARKTGRVRHTQDHVTSGPTGRGLRWVTAMARTH